MPDPLNVTDSHPGMVVNTPNNFFIGVDVSADPQDTTVTQSSAPAAPVTAGGRLVEYVYHGEFRQGSGLFSPARVLLRQHRDPTHNVLEPFSYAGMAVNAHDPQNSVGSKAALWEYMTRTTGPTPHPSSLLDAAESLRVAANQSAAALAEVTQRSEQTTANPSTDPIDLKDYDSQITSLDDLYRPVVLARTNDEDLLLVGTGLGLYQAKLCRFIAGQYDPTTFTEVSLHKHAQWGSKHSASPYDMYQKCIQQAFSSLCLLSYSVNPYGGRSCGVAFADLPTVKRFFSYLKKAVEGCLATAGTPVTVSVRAASEQFYKDALAAGGFPVSDPVSAPIRLKAHVMQTGVPALPVTVSVRSADEEDEDDEGDSVTHGPHDLTQFIGAEAVVESCDIMDNPNLDERSDRVTSKGSHVHGTVTGVYNSCIRLTLWKKKHAKVSFAVARKAKYRHMGETVWRSADGAIEPPPMVLGGLYLVSKFPALNDWSPAPSKDTILVCEGEGQIGSMCIIDVASGSLYENQVFSDLASGATTRLTYLGGLSDLLSKGGVLPK